MTTVSDAATRLRLGHEPFLARDVEGRRILLHACCAPDATLPLGLWGKLARELAVLFYNPNIHPREEYVRRLEDMRLVAGEWETPLIEGRYLQDEDDAVPDGLASHPEAAGEASVAAVERLPAMVTKALRGGDVDETLDRMRPFAEEPEGGARCELCFGLRLTRTAAMAHRLGFDAFATTLTISPHKNTDMVNALGQKAADRFGVDYIWTNFKRREGFKRSIIESHRLGLYRQTYCGCIYSQGKQPQAATSAQRQ